LKMIPTNEINLKTQIRINDEELDLEIFSIENGLIKAIKLNNDVFELNNGFKQSDETPIFQLVKVSKEKPDKKKRGRPALKNTKLIKFIDSKGKQSWSLDDFFRKHPESERNKDRIDKQLSMLIELRKIIQLDNKTFRRNV